MNIGNVILLACLTLWYAVCRSVFRLGVRDAAWAVWLGAYAFVFVSTEALSALRALGRPGILVAWCAVLGIAGVLLWRRRRMVVPVVVTEPVVWGRALGALRSLFPVAFWVCAGLFLFTAVHAVLSPPFEIDAMTYHLPRVQHWLANRSIGFYDTAIVRQNYQAPGYSFALCHLIALTATDRWVNLIQWIAYGMGGVTASLIAREAGARLRGQGLAGLLAWSLPAAISQSFTCVNDQFAAVPVLGFVLALIRWLRAPDRMRHGIVAGAAMGLALLAKWTALVYVAAFALPVSVAALVSVGRRSGFGRAARLAALLAFVALGGVCVILPHVARNLRMYGDPFSGEPPGMLTTVRLTPRKVAVNVVRHVATHLTFPLRVLNRPLERAVAKWAGAELNDPDITYCGAVYDWPFALIPPLGKGTASAANPLHLLLFTVAGAVWLIRWKRNRDLVMAFGLPVWIGAGMYCLLFKWQLWSARLQIPLFLLMGTGVAVWLERCRPGARVRAGVLGVMMGYAAFHLFLRPTWYLPPFLYGRGTPGGGIPEHVSVAKKVRMLMAGNWPRAELRHMARTVPPEMAWGYSLFFTPRDRQYLGNETFLERNTEYAVLRECLAFLLEACGRQGFCPTIGLLISSENGRLAPEARLMPYSYEYLFWALARNVTGTGFPRFAHFGTDDPERVAQRVMGGRPGLIVSDRTRERVLERLARTREVSCVQSNRLFAVYAVRPFSGKGVSGQ
ncbi:MAG: hypothetical protein RBT78_05200 [Kiritimatiellia bacterium]|nr:hypothetical protein [Kiritimatiellia bacterium]